MKRDLDSKLDNYFLNYFTSSLIKVTSTVGAKINICSGFFGLHKYA